MSSLRRQPLLNKLQIKGPVWLASDMHLNESNTATASAFYAFLGRAENEASALFLLGDIFDVWVGDDVIKHPAPWLQSALEALSKCAARIPVYVGLGNRDFLIGKALTDYIGAHALAEQTLLSVGATQALISHGDEYCTLDHSYQRFKWWVRQPWVQWAFQCLSLSKRLKIAAQARAQSMKKMVLAMQSPHHPSAHILDVSDDAVIDCFVKKGVRTLIHGHTHRPGQHTYKVNSQTCTRWVLPDWEYDHLTDSALPRGGFLILNDQGIELVLENKKSNN